MQTQSSAAQRLLSEAKEELDRFSCQNEAEFSKSAEVFLSNHAKKSFFMSNEDKTHQQIHSLSALPVTKRKGFRVAILVGESSFLSMLPELKKHADVVLLVDIDKRVRAHNDFLLHTIKTSASREQFSDRYCGIMTNPLTKHAYISIPETVSAREVLRHALDDYIKRANERCQQYNFLGSEERYCVCKQAAESTPIINIHLNILSEKSIVELKELLTSFNAEVTLVNVTNIQDYDANYSIHNIYSQEHGKWEPKKTLLESLSKLLTMPDDSIILYSQLDAPADTEATMIHQLILTAKIATSLTEFTKAQECYKTYIQGIQEKERMLNQSKFLYFSHSDKVNDQELPESKPPSPG